MASSSADDGSASSRGSSAAGTKWSASPAAIPSAAPTGDPVSARCVPSSPGARESSHDPPTSGCMPMPTSGIASRDRSVTTRTDACAEIPIPPPMTRPSMIATIGFGYAAMVAFNRYSSAQKPIDAVPPETASAWIIRMSPPAQSPRSPFPLITTVRTADGPAHSASASRMIVTISGVSALIAFGRFSVSRPIGPSTSTTTGSLCMILL